jgi:DMSO/TMAO reductase YedYZ molybdopterin-dependent catalytic subunit
MVVLLKYNYHPAYLFSRLEPDHGFPLRLVVPGEIGGRSVKWLTRIELSAIESQHHLHFHDNKVLPMPLGPEKVRTEKKWWYDPRCVCTLSTIPWPHPVH